MRQGGPIFVLPHIYTAYLGAIPPIVGLFLTGAISVYKDFESVNRTHCRVPNFVPSISSCIGNATPQRYIWRASIAMMLTVRSYSGLVYYHWFQVCADCLTHAANGLCAREAHAHLDASRSAPHRGNAVVGV